MDILTLDKTSIMKAELKSIYCIDIEVGLQEFKPKEIDNFGFWLTIIVGEMGVGGEESFDTLLCTPKWLMENHTEADVLIGIHHLVVFKYDYDRIYRYIKGFVENQEAKSWDELAQKISVIGKWEFEDYLG